MEFAISKNRELASIRSRAFALFIDIFILGSFYRLIGELDILNLTLSDNSVFKVGSLITIVIIFLYLCVLPMYLQGRTLGKLVLKIRIATLDNKPLTLSRLFTRNWLGYMASSIGGLGYIWAINNELHQTWHDMAAKTIVVQDNVDIS